MNASDYLTLQARLGVSPSMAQLVGMLVDNAVVTPEMIHDARLSKRPVMTVSRLRQKLLEHIGVDVLSLRGAGYWVDHQGRQDIEAFVRNNDMRPRAVTRSGKLVGKQMAEKTE